MRSSSKGGFAMQYLSLFSIMGMVQNRQNGVCVCVFVTLCNCMCSWWSCMLKAGGPSQVSVLRSHLPHILRQSLSLAPVVQQLDQAACQQAPGIFLSPTRQCYDGNLIIPHLAFYMGCGGQLKPHICSSDIIPASVLATIASIVLFIAIIRLTLKPYLLGNGILVHA